MRKSKLLKGDTNTLMKLTQELQNEIYEYVLNGFKETGPHSDFHCYVKMRELHTKFNELFERK